MYVYSSFYKHIYLTFHFLVLLLFARYQNFDRTALPARFK